MRTFTAQPASWGIHSVLTGRRVLKRHEMFSKLARQFWQGLATASASGRQFGQGLATPVYSGPSAARAVSNDTGDTSALHHTKHVHNDDSSDPGRANTFL